MTDDTRAGQCPTCGSPDKARRLHQLNYLPPDRCINPWHDEGKEASMPCDHECGTEQDHAVCKCVKCDAYFRPNPEAAAVGKEATMPTLYLYDCPSCGVSQFSNDPDAALNCNVTTCQTPMRRFLGERDGAPLWQQACEAAPAVPETNDLHPETRQPTQVA